MSSYQFETLNSSKNEFRLLRVVHTHSATGALEVKVYRYEIDKAPVYLALSYVCGDPNTRRSIRVNGQAFLVTPNLYDALQRLASRQHYLWIDAICIHQEDDLERSQQVRMMGRIFEGAKHVFLWLGPSMEESNLAFELIRAWSSTLRQDILQDFQGFLTRNPIAFDESAWKALRRLLARPWWRRIWTYQEFVLSQNASFLCGEDRLQLAEVDSAIMTWFRLPSDYLNIPITTSQVRCISNVSLDDFVVLRSHRIYHNQSPAVRQNWTNRLPVSLSALLSKLHQHGSTDPRDKIFALLAVDETHKIAIEPDYSKSAAEIYLEYAVKDIESSMSLAVVTMSGVGISCESVEKLQLPSWVPDFRSSASWPLMMSGSRFRASGDIKAQIQAVMDSKKLYASGALCDVIVKSLPPSNYYKDKLERLYPRL